MNILAKYFGFLFPLCLILSSCTFKDNTNNIEQIIHFDNDSLSKLNLSTICKSADYIPLETNSSSVIGNIKKLRIYSNNIYILDDISNSIICFNLQGEFKFKINNIGKGIGQYIRIQDFTINQYNNTIDIYDMGNRKIISYDLMGKYITTFDFKIGIMSFMAISQTNYIVFTNKLTLPLENDAYSSDILIINNEGKVLKNYYPYSADYASSTIYNTQTLVFSFGEFYVNLIYDDILYKLKDNKLLPFIKFNFGKNSLTPLINTFPPNELYYYINADKYSYYPVILFEDEEIMVLEYINGKNYYYSLIHKKSNWQTSFHDALINDINDFPISRDITFYPPNDAEKAIIFNKSIFCGFSEDFLYGYIFPEWINDLDQFNNLNDIKNNPIVLVFNRN